MTELRDKLRASWHEPAHAVVAITVGYTVVSATIKPHDDAHGRVRYRHSKLRCRRDYEDMIVMCFAGPEAELLLPYIAEPGEGDDIERVQDLIMEASRAKIDMPVGTCDRMRKRARRMVQQHEHAIAVVADELLIRETMTGRQIRVVIAKQKGRPDGTASKSKRMWKTMAVQIFY